MVFTLMRRRKKTDEDKTHFLTFFIRNWATAIINLKKAPANTQTNDGCLLWIKKRTIFWALLPSNTWNWSQNSSFCSTSFTFKLIKGYAITRKKEPSQQIIINTSCFLSTIKKARTVMKYKRNDTNKITPTTSKLYLNDKLGKINIQRNQI